MLATLLATTLIASSGVPIGDAYVAALRTVGFSFAKGTVAAANGEFVLGGLAAGDYYVYALDPTGRHAAGFYGAPLIVTVGPTGMTDADPALAGLRGRIDCVVTDEGSGAPPACLPAYPASVTRGTQATNPLAGFTTVGARRYHFLFNSSARYVLTNPTQPEDQFDWNKLPGISD